MKNNFVKNDTFLKQDWQIRPAVIGDAKGLSACMRSAYQLYEPRMKGASLPPMILDYAQEIQQCPTWVVEHQGKIVGGLTMMFEDGYATLANIAVSLDFQGQGLGRGLMVFAESRAKEKTYQEIRLATHVLLVETVSLYQHLNWVEYDRDETRVYFKKCLFAH